MKTNRKQGYNAPRANIFKLSPVRCMLADSNNLSAGSLYDGLDLEDEDFFTK